MPDTTDKSPAEALSAAAPQGSPRPRVRPQPPLPSTDGQQIREFFGPSGLIDAPGDRRKR